MDCLLPNDIARLVYGYLEDEGCSSAAKVFLETSDHMKTCLTHMAKGRRIMTTFNGLRLIELLDLMADVTSYVRDLKCSKDMNLDETLRQLRCLLKLNAAEGNFVKLTSEPDTGPSETPQPTSKRSPRKKKPLDSTPKSSNLSEMTSKPDLPSPNPAELAYQVIMEHKVFHEKLAENINKEVASKTDDEFLEKVLQKEIVENIINNTEKDPFFDEMLEELVVVKNVDRNSSYSAVEVDPGFISDCLDGNTTNQPDQGNSSVCSPTLNTSVAINPVQQTAAQTPNISGRNTQMLSSPKNIIEKAFAMSSPPGQSAIHVLKPVISTPPATFPSPNTLSVISQASPTYVLTSSSMMVTPSVVLGTTFCGAEVRLTPTGPSLSRIRHNMSLPHSRINVARPVRPSLQMVLPKPPVMSPSSVVPRPVSHQGDSPSTSLQKCVATMRGQAISASPVLTHTLTSVKLGARTRGGKVKTYAGRKKIVTTLSPTMAVPRFEPKTPMKVCESGVNVVDKGNAQRSAEKHQEESVGNILTDPLESSVDVTEDKNPAGIANPAESIRGTVTTGKRVAKLDNKVTKLDADVVLADVEVTKSDAGLAKFNAQVNKSSEEPPKNSSSLPVNPCSGEAGGSMTNSVPCRPDATPQQGTEPRVKLRKRLSLSTPRRGSHVRTLEFKTPPKHSSIPRKSLSSPKNKDPEIRRPELQKKLESIKKSELFKSPQKKEKKEWDADLRIYTTEEDVPTSVGLKRKYNKPSGPVNASKSKSSKNNPRHDNLKSANVSPKIVENTVKKAQESPVKGTTTKTPDGKNETDEDLVKRIQRDVLDVIDEEDIDLSSAGLCVKTSEGGESPRDSPKLVKSPIRSPGTSSILEIGDIGLSASAIKKLYRRTTSVDENSCTMDSPLSKAPKETLYSPKKSQIEASKENLFVSPIKSVLEPTTNEVSLRLHLTPTQAKREIVSTPPKVGSASHLASAPNSVPVNVGILYSELTRSPVVASGIIQSPSSGSLERVLIKECCRIEKAASEIIPEEKNFKSPESGSLHVNTGTMPYVENTEEIPRTLSHLLPPPGITPLKTLPSDPIGKTPLKTPWKPLVTTLVEMTPLSKIIHEETRLGKCSLLTPTIPPTPDHEELKSQPGDANTPFASQKTPQSKTPEPVDTTPSPPKKLRKTPSKTPVVKLRKASTETAAKSRKKKPPKDPQLKDNTKRTVKAAQERKVPLKSKPEFNDETSTEIRAEIDQAKLKLPPKRKAPVRKRKSLPKSKVKPNKVSEEKQSNETKEEEPVGLEVPPKKKSTRKKRVPTKPEEKPKKESDSKPSSPVTAVKIPTFQEMLEYYEKSKIEFSSSSEDSTPFPQHIQDIPPATKRQSTIPQFSGFITRSKDSDNSRKKKTSKDMESSGKPSSKEERSAPIVSNMVSNSASLNQDVAAKKNAGAFDDSDCSKESEDQRWMVTKPLTRLKSGSNEWTQSVFHVNPDKTADATRSQVEGSCSSSVRFDVHNVVLSELDEGFQAALYVSPFLPLFEYPPPTSLPREKLFDGPRSKAVEESGMRRQVKSRSTVEDMKSPVQSPYVPNIASSDQNPSPEHKKRKGRTLIGSSSQEKEQPRGAMGLSIDRCRKGKPGSKTRLRMTGHSILDSSDNDEPSGSPLGLSSNSINVIENTKSNQTRYNSESSTDDDEPTPRASWSARLLEKNAESCHRKQKRYCSRSSTEDDEPTFKPNSLGGLSSDKIKLIEAIAKSQRRKQRRYRSGSSCDEGEPPLKPSVSSRDLDEVVISQLRRLMKCRSRSSSETEERPKKPVRLSNESSNKLEKIASSRKRVQKRCRSGSSSEEDDSYRKRRRTADPHRPKYERQPRVERDKRCAVSPQRAHRSQQQHSSIGRDDRRKSSNTMSMAYSRHESRGRALSRSRLPGKFLVRDRSRKQCQESTQDRSRRPKTSRPRSWDNEGYQSKSHRYCSTPKDRSRTRYQELGKGFRRDESNDEGRPLKSHRDESKERQDDFENPCDRSRHRYPTADKDSSRRIDPKESLKKPTSHHDKQFTLKEPPPSIRLAPRHTSNNPRPKLSRTPLNDREDGEISDESCNTIFKFSKNAPSEAPGATVDRLSSPVSSESRQKLLQNVNVEKFLTLLHGDAKSPLAKEGGSNVGS